mmetsp:Transcript_1863/g.3992  ORF Transcript_1863/g.3992 Transcript_1863/m.3992 type:complete len:450 (+) Transcript_1863:2236-3585(+)
MQRSLTNWLPRGFSNTFRPRTYRFVEADNEDNCSFKLLSHYELEQEPLKTVEELKLPEEIRTRLLKFGPTLTFAQSKIWPLIYKNLDIALVSSLPEDRISTYCIPQLTMMNQNSPELSLLVLSNANDMVVKNWKGIKAAMKQQHLNMQALNGNDSLVDASCKFRESKVIIAETFKINELLEAQLIDKRQVNTIIVDSVDLQQDSGYEGSLLNIFNKLIPKQRIIISKSWQRQVQGLIEKLAPNSVTAKLSLGIKQPNLRHYMSFAPERFKYDRILYPLKNPKASEKILVYTSSDKTTEYLQTLLLKYEMKVEALRDNSEAHEVNEVMHNLYSGVSNGVITTLGASRHLKTGYFQSVFNYSVPMTIEDYRDRLMKIDFSKYCKITSLISYSDSIFASVIFKVCQEADISVPVELAELENKLEDKDPGADEDIECNSRFERQSNENDYFDS